MFIDIAKYITTAGIVGGIVSEKMTPILAVSFIVVATISFVIGFYIIPPKKED